MVALTPLSSCEKACDIVRLHLASNTHMGLTEDLLSLESSSSHVYIILVTSYD